MEEKAPTVAQITAGLVGDGHDRGAGGDPERGSFQEADIDKIERVYK